MEFVSIFNDVMGPVMRGPSSSHTAGAYRIGRIIRSLFNDEPRSMIFTFDTEGSFAATYKPLGSDLAFTAGVLGMSIEDLDYCRVLEIARSQGLDVRFDLAALEKADHPNMVKVEILSCDDRPFSATARSIGGGVVEITQVEGWPVLLTGKSYEYLILTGAKHQVQIEGLLQTEQGNFDSLIKQERGSEVLIQAKLTISLSEDICQQIRSHEGVKNFRSAVPVFYVRQGDAIFSTAEEMVSLAQEKNCSLGEIALEYEAQLLGLPKEKMIAEMSRRFEIMKTSCAQGLQDEQVDMMMLQPTANKIFTGEKEGKLALGGIPTRAAARAMAVMHTCNSRGIVCAAPTGGSAGVIPGVLVTLAEEKNVAPQEIIKALFAASAVGLHIARQSNFSAEVAGCQVEIGAAGAMAAAAVVELAGGTVKQATDAAAIALQNTLGSVCDPVQGACEIPCHTRNAVAASNAFICADLILGGYENPIPLCETIDASFTVGTMLPGELRCTAQGGIAITPSALKLPRLR
jgi:L-serine dehydratase